MNGMPGVAGADAALPATGSPAVAMNISVPGQVVLRWQSSMPSQMPWHAQAQMQDQMQLPAVEPSMQVLMEQLAQTAGLPMAAANLSADGTENQLPAGSTDPVVADDDLPLLQQLPAMQLPWSWPQAALERQAHMPPQAVPAQDDQGIVAMADVDGVDSALTAVTPFAAAVKHPAPSALNKTLPGEVVWTPAEQATPVLAAPGRAAPEALRPVSTEAQVLMPKDSLPVHKGSQALVQALADRVQVQQLQGAQIATVRLDPPQMGSLEIRIRQDAAGVHVQLQASHAEVGRQLATVADSLRQELLARSHDAQVTVSHSRSMSSGGQSDAQRQGQPWAEEPKIGQALQNIEGGALT